MRQATILIVDDEQGPRESLRMILSSAHEILTSDSGVDALEILRSTPVDLVTIDLNMPGMKGEELIRTIRERHPQTEMIVITGYGSLESAVDGIRYGVFDYLTKPFDVVQVSAAVNRALERRRSRQRLVDFLENIGSVLGRERATEDVLHEIEANPNVRQRLEAVIQGPALDPTATRTAVGDHQSVEFLEVLAETIENRDEHMRGHARRVAFLASLVAERMCLDEEEREQIRLAAFLHDLGKVGVDNEIVSRPAGLLPSEREHVEEHSVIGERLIKPLGFSSAVSTAIRHHHERWDGGGYPDGLTNADIPLASAIIAVADAFDAMTCERPYRSRLSIEAALDELRKHAGSQFAPHIVDEFVAVIESDSDGYVADAFAPEAMAPTQGDLA